MSKLAVMGWPVGLRGARSWPGLPKRRVLGCAALIGGFVAAAAAAADPQSASAALRMAESAAGANAAGATGSAIEWKFTLGQYRTPTEGTATDLNLRGSLGATTFWLGHYTGADGFRQARAGLERWHELPVGRLLTTVQVAEGRYLNGSVNLEAGQGELKALLGFSRTNLREYYNIDFNSNDSFTVGAAVDQANGGRWSLYAVQDNRTGPGQRLTHLNYRPAYLGDHRLTIDLFHRYGAVPWRDRRVSVSGATVTFDYRPVFVRLAYDPKVNFTAVNMWRLSVGTHF